jgi:hypothetical protein
MAAAARAAARAGAAGRKADYVLNQAMMAGARRKEGA